MQRTKSINKSGDGRIQWIKRGRGFFRLPNRIIKPGEVFWAHPSEISMAFRDTIVPVDAVDLKNLAEQRKVVVPPSRRVLERKNGPRHIERQKPPSVKEEDLKVEKPSYTKVPRDEGGVWFDIVDSRGKIINEKALRSEQADEYINSLQK